MRKLFLFLLFCTPLWGQVFPVQQSKPQFFNSNGTVCAGCKLNTYAAGTTNPIPTFTDSTGLVQNPNPVVMDSAGRPPNEIWMSNVSYKLNLQTSAGANIWTTDGIKGAYSSTQYFIGDSTCSAPALTFTAETNTGLIRSSAGNIGLCILGVKSWNFSATAITSGAVGVGDIGSFSFPIVNFYLGNAATNNAKIHGIFAAPRDLTVPDPLGNDTFVFTNALQSITNKLFVDPTDATKKWAITLSGSSTNTLGTWNFSYTRNSSLNPPDVTVGSMATINNAQTWSGTGLSFGLTAPTVVPTCAGTCASTWGYKVVAIDPNGDPGVASAERTTLVQAAVLDSTHFNTITWNKVSGASNYVVFRSTRATTPANLGVIAIISDSAAASFVDNGINGSGATATTVDQTGQQKAFTPRFNVDGPGFKAKTFTATCLTTNVAFNMCTEVLTWNTPFPDAIYIPICTGITQVQSAAGPTIESITAAGFTVRVTTLQAVISGFNFYDCIGIRP